MTDGNYFELSVSTTVPNLPSNIANSAGRTLVPGHSSSLSVNLMLLLISQTNVSVNLIAQLKL